MFLDTPFGMDPIAVTNDTVRADVPPLLKLDVLYREKLSPDVAYNLLAHRHRVKSEKHEPSTSYTCVSPCKVSQ